MYRCMLNKAVDAPVVVQVPLEEYRSAPSGQRPPPGQHTDDDDTVPQLSANFVLFHSDLRHEALKRGLLHSSDASALWDIVAQFVELSEPEEISS